MQHMRAIIAFLGPLLIACTGPEYGGTESEDHEADEGTDTSSDVPTDLTIYDDDSEPPIDGQINDGDVEAGIPDTTEPQSCISIVGSDAGFHFGPREFGGRYARPVTVSNCSDELDLTISQVSLLEHEELPGLGRFSLEGLPNPDSALILPPHEEFDFFIVYQPIMYSSVANPDICSTDPCEVIDGAVLYVISTDPENSPLEIEVTGSGTGNYCPIAILQGRTTMEGDWSVGELTIQSAATVYLSGSESYDPDGTVSTYLWDLTQKPGNSNALLPSTTNESEVPFDIDKFGLYIVELSVVDMEGMASCATAELRIEVLSGGAIMVRLDWDTDLTDLDLHFLHPNACMWNAAPWDCYYANQHPNWRTSSRDDDPELTIDDRDGYGPEIITLDIPEGSEEVPFTYRVGVFYYSDHGHGQSTPTVRIYLDGEERFSSTLPDLVDHEFWDVARITWPSGDITRIHRRYPSGFPPL